MARKALLLVWAAWLAASLAHCSLVDLVAVERSRATAIVQLVVVEDENVLLHGQIRLDTGIDEHRRIRSLPDPAIQIGPYEIAPASVSASTYLYEVTSNLDAQTDTLALTLPPIPGTGRPQTRIALALQKRPGPFLLTLDGEGVTIDLPGQWETNVEPSWIFELSATCNPRTPPFLSLFGKGSLPAQLHLPANLIAHSGLDHFEACLRRMHQRAFDDTEYATSLSIQYQTTWRINRLQGNEGTD